MIGRVWLDIGAFSIQRGTYCFKRQLSTPTYSIIRGSEKDAAKYVLSSAEKAKAILFGRITGTFTTIATTKSESAPSLVPLNGSIMPYILHSRWYCHPIVSIRKDEFHYQNLLKYPNSSLTVFPLTPEHVNPSEVPLPRINVTGNSTPITNENDIEIILNKYNEVFPGALQYLRQEDIFTHYELKIKDVNIITAAGRLESITGEDFLKAKDDPIAPVSRRIIEKINLQMPEEIKLLCKSYGEIDVNEAFVFALDRLGFDILGKDDSGSWYSFRMPFPQPITNPEEYNMTMIQSLKDVSKKK